MLFFSGTGVLMQLQTAGEAKILSLSFSSQPIHEY
jgi:hypothetical protein